MQTWCGRDRSPKHFTNKLMSDVCWRSSQNSRVMIVCLRDVSALSESIFHRMGPESKKNKLSQPTNIFGKDFLELAREHTHAHEVQRALTSSQVLGLKDVSQLLDACRASKQAPFCFFDCRSRCGGRIAVSKLLDMVRWSRQLYLSAGRVSVVQQTLCTFTVGRGSEEQLLVFFLLDVSADPETSYCWVSDVIRGFN